jgi:hypothetical protein
LTYFELLSACWTGFQPYLGGDQNTLADGLSAGVVTSAVLMIDIVYRSCVCGLALGGDRARRARPNCPPLRAPCKVAALSVGTPSWLATKST